MSKTRIRGIAAAVAMLVSAAAAHAQSTLPGVEDGPATPSGQAVTQLDGVSIDQKLNAQLPLDLPFKDETGRTVRLGDYFGERPVVLAFVYYECPMLCTQILNGMTSALVALDETAGQEFDVVTVSFDARETPVLAAAKKTAYVERYGREGTAPGWHFLTGDESSIAKLTEAAGFKYRWDEATQQFAHASAIMVVTPDGRMSRYFYGIEYAPRDLKFALMESSQGRIGSPVDKILLYCYHYDPKTGSYGLVAMNAVRVGGAVTLVALVGFVVVAIRREKRAGQ
ncbi:MAG: SCO family protein [Vicinamibacterales bacterium]